MFKVEGSTLVFDKKSSSPLPERAEGEPGVYEYDVIIPDGATFEKSY